jgi:threonine aldolase
LNGQTAESFKRSLAAQFDALLDGDGWRAPAKHANAMASRLTDGMAGVPGVRLTQVVDANAVFAILPPGAAEELQRR